jgi:hypothetical protein
VVANSDLLAAWILSLPDGDFARCAGTPTMDRWVGKIIDAEMSRRNDATQAGPLEDFLGRLNLRLKSLHD